MFEKNIIVSMFHGIDVFINGLLNYICKQQGGLKSNIGEKRSKCVFLAFPVQWNGAHIALYRLYDLRSGENTLDCFGVKDVSKS